MLRCVTLNLWGENGPHAERLMVAADRLRALNPDVVALQEVRARAPDVPNQAESLAAALQMSHVFAPAMSWGGGDEGLAILSRAPIAETRTTELPHATETERRLLLSARLDLGSSSLWVHTTHLNYRLTHGVQREDQVRALHAVIESCTPDNPQILLGDFNARPETDEIRWLCGLTTIGGTRAFYQDAWALLHPTEPGWTWSAANPYTADLAFLQPDRRIDYIFVTPRRRDGRGVIAACSQALEKPDERGIYASDHFAVTADVQIEPG